MDKKRFVLFLLVLLLISGCIPKFSPTQMEIVGLECYDYKPDITTIPGDVNLDRKTDFRDLGPIISHILDGKQTITKEQYEEIIPVIGRIEICAADYDKDGAVTIKDLKLLARDGFFKERTKLMYECEGIGFSHGDLNSDGVINILDVVMLVNLVLGESTDETTSAICAGDVNEDGELNVLDVVSLIGAILSDSAFCGDGLVDDLNYFEFHEECDGENLNDETCESQGHDSGSLSCNFCSFDYSLCEGFPDEAIPELDEFDDDNFIPGSGVSFNGTTFEYTEGWNMISLPLGLEESDYLAIFPDAEEDSLYSYNGTFNNNSELISGVGYWLRFLQDGESELIGNPIIELNLSLSEGWNLIPGISVTINISNINDSDGIIIPGTIYGYNGLYYNPEVIEPGNSYWVRASEEGNITLSSIIGCMNPNATNYNPEATTNFGNCEYEESGEIGQEGGIVNSGETFVLIPPGALDSNTIINVSDVTEEISQEGYETVSSYYAFMPHDQNFNLDVIISIPYYSEDSDLKFIKLDNLEDVDWELVDGDFGSGIGTLTTNGFSILGIVQIEEETVEPSCEGICGGGYGYGGCYEDFQDTDENTCECYCDEDCSFYGDCCEDISDFCDYSESFCGDGYCNSDEGCSSCSTDCGTCDDDTTEEEVECVENELECFENNLKICQSNSWNLVDICYDGCSEGSCNAPIDEEALFDIIVSINEESTTPGNNIFSEIILYNFGTLRPVDVGLNCTLQDENLTIYDSFSQTLAVEFQTTILEEMVVPDDILLGNYFVTCYLSYENMTVTSSDLIRIVSAFETRLPSTETVLVVILIIFSTLALLIIILLLIKLVRMGVIKGRIKRKKHIKKHRNKHRKKHIKKHKKK